MKKFRTWFMLAAILQLLTGFVHSLSFFSDRPATNEEEKQLKDLLATYQFNMGAGFHRTLGSIILALSASFALLCFLGGWTNLFLLRKKTDPVLLKGILHINLVVFGITAILMAIFTFLPPIIMTMLIFVLLLIARISWKSSPY